jgi:hypothetical protein
MSSKSLKLDPNSVIAANENILLDRTDSSGIRFYLGNQFRQHDLGYLTFGAASDPFGIAIPPGADRFIIDSYCTKSASQVS